MLIFALKWFLDHVIFIFFPHFAIGVGGFWKVRKIPHFFFWTLPLGKLEIREWLEAILRILELIYGKGEVGGKHTIFFQEEGRLKSRLYMKFKC